MGIATSFICSIIDTGGPLGTCSGLLLKFYNQMGSWRGDNRELHGIYMNIIMAAAVSDEEGICSGNLANISELYDCLNDLSGDRQVEIIQNGELTESFVMNVVAQGIDTNSNNICNEVIEEDYCTANVSIDLECMECITLDPSADCEDISSEDCFQWSNDSEEATQEICPVQNTMITVIVTNNDGDKLAEINYEINVDCDPEDCIGQPCDTSDPCLEGTLNESCDCISTPKPDTDGDGICDELDNCPEVYNPQQGPCSDCPTVDCNDGDDCTTDAVDTNCNCINTPKPDTDGDGICDEQDNCPEVYNPQQGPCPDCSTMDCNDDDDCTTDAVDTNCNCINTPKPDTDRDGVCDEVDICPQKYNRNQDPTDADGNGIPDECEVEDFEAWAMPEQSCEGEAILLNATSGFSNYEWINQRGDIVLTQRSGTVYSTGSYGVSAISPSGQRVEAAVYIEEIESDSNFDLIANQNPVCQGGSSTLSVENIISQGNANISWEANGQSGSSSSFTIDNITEDTQVSVTVCDDSGSCCKESSVVIRVGEFAAPVINPNPVAICPTSGEPTLVTITNYDPSSDYYWLNSEGSLIHQGSSYSVAAVGAYTIYRDNGSCTSETSFVVMEDTSACPVTCPDVGAECQFGAGCRGVKDENCDCVAFDFDEDGDIDCCDMECDDCRISPCCSAIGDISISVYPEDYCYGDMVTLTLEGLEDPFMLSNIVWSTGQVLTPSIQVILDKSYSVTVTDTEGCEQYAEINVEEFDIAFDLQLAMPMDSLWCTNWADDTPTTIEIKNTSGDDYSYQWEDGTMGSSVVVYPSMDIEDEQSPYYYKVTVTDTKGCEKIDSISIRPIECPCPGDPVVNPEIAPTWTGGNNYDYKRGLFGCTRNSSPTCPANCPEGNGKQAHYAIDIGSNSMLDQPIHSMYDGEIVDISNNCEPNECNKDNVNCGVLGNWIAIKTLLDGQNIHIRYGHLNEVYFSNSDIGTMVKQGQIIGLMGRTGNLACDDETITHTHIVVYINGIYGTGDCKRLNPLDFFGSNYDSTTNTWSNERCK